MNTGEALEWNLVIFVGAVPRTPLGNTLPEEEIENDTSKESFFCFFAPSSKDEATTQRRRRLHAMLLCRHINDYDD